MSKIIKVLMVLVLMLISSLPLTPAKIKAATTSTISMVAIGDSNTTGWLAGTTPWFTRLENQIEAAYPANTYTFTNLAVNATSVTPTEDGGQALDYDIDAALASINPTDIGFIMLGTNDAWRGQPTQQYQDYYKRMIYRIKRSGKISRLYVLAVPPMISPFNCIGVDCWNNTHNPQTERVAPFNSFLSGISPYCNSIGYTCSYINASYGIQLNSTYIYSGDGVHLLNNSQQIIANNVYNTIRTNLLAISPLTHNASYVSQKMYTVVPWFPPQVPANVTYTMKNTGSVNWTAAAGYKLGFFASASSYSTYALPANVTVAPGESYTFSFNPNLSSGTSSSGSRYAQMLKGTTPFGDRSPTVTYTKSNYATRGALFASQDLPTEMAPGETRDVYITMQNSGMSYAWVGTQFYGLGVENPAAWPWQNTRAYIGQEDIVHVGETRTFTFSITAPTTPGVYYFQVRPLQENVTWFGTATPSLPITVR